MEIILDEFLQYTLRLIIDIKSMDMSKTYLFVKYYNDIICNLTVYNGVDFIDFITMGYNHQKKSYKIYMLEHDFGYGKIKDIIANIRKNQLSNATNKFRKILIHNSKINFVTIYNCYNSLNNSAEIKKEYGVDIETIYI